MTAAPHGPEPVGALALARCALALAAVLVFYTMFADWLFLARGGPKPLHEMVALGAATAVVVALQPRRPMPLLRSPLFAWACAYTLLTVLWGIWMRGDADVVQVLADRVRSILFLLTCAAIFDAPRARRVGVVAVAVAAMCAAGLNVAQMLGAVHALDDLDRIAGRAAGLYINPNVSGLAIVFGLAVATPALSRPWRFPLLIAGTVGVAATFSRGAEACLAVLFLALLWRKEVHVWPTAVTAVLVAAALATWGDRAIAVLDARGTLSEDARARLMLTADDSGRGELAQLAWQTFARAPLTGNGLGSAATWNSSEGSHDLYLSLAIDHGVLGLLVLPGLALALVAGRRRATPLWVVLLAAGLFSHNLLEEGPALVCVALAATGAAPAREARRAPRAGAVVGPWRTRAA